MNTPHGQVTASYGSFGTSNAGFNLGYGGAKWGNFVSANGLNSGRFLDPPEFTVMHAKGNEENLFDRLDFQLTNADSVHLNLGYTRSWFQTPNSFDAQNATAWNGLVVNNGGLDPNGNVVGPADQRSQIRTFNIAPSWTRLLNNYTVFTLGAFVRRDHFNYYPSGNPFADLAPDLQQETLTQDRKLTNAGIRSDISYVKGIHNIKGGVTYQQTFLDEDNRFGIAHRRQREPMRGFQRKPDRCPLHNSGALRSDPRRNSVSVQWSLRCKAAVVVLTGCDQQGKLVDKSWSPRRHLQRPDVA
jgi:hypothetical protein